MEGSSRETHDLKRLGPGPEFGKAEIAPLGDILARRAPPRGYAVGDLRHKGFFKTGAESIRNKRSSIIRICHDI